MGVHVSSDHFQSSVTFITTEGREQQPRVPVIGLDAGCMPGRKPGCTTVRALEAELRDLRGAQTSKGTSRLAIAKRASANGILRTRRITV